MTLQLFALIFSIIACAISTYCAIEPKIKQRRIQKRVEELKQREASRGKL